MNLELDVRAEAADRRHQLIFENHDALAPGSSARPVTDHHAKPLSYQLGAAHAGELGWEPPQQGPRAWRARIGSTGAGSESAS